METLISQGEKKIHGGANANYKTRLLICALFLTGHFTVPVSYFLQAKYSMGKKGSGCHMRYLGNSTKLIPERKFKLLMRLLCRRNGSIERWKGGDGTTIGKRGKGDKGLTLEK